LIVAQSRNQSHRASFQEVSDTLKIERTSTQAKSGSSLPDGMRRNLDSFEATIKTGGKQ
jgi:hypothetical protein